MDNYGPIAFTSFGVPHFIFISGVVLYNKYNNVFSISTFYKKRFSSILPPYLIWSTFYFAFFYVWPIIDTYISHHPVHGLNQTIASLVGTYLEELAVGIQHLWFVVIIIQLYLIYPFLVKMYNRAARQNGQLIILSVLLLAQIGWPFLLKGVVYPSIPPTLGKFGFGGLLAGLVIRYSITYSSFLLYVFYFTFGFFIAQRYGAIKQRIATLSLKSISLVVLISTIYYAVVYYRVAVLSGPAPSYFVWLYSLTGPFYCLILIFFYLKMCIGWAEPHGFLLQSLEKIGEDSFGIFLVHFFFVWEFRAALSTLGLSANNLLFYPVLFLLTLIASYLSVQAIYRLPFSNIIIGRPRKEESKPPQTAQISSMQ